MSPWMRPGSCKINMRNQVRLNVHISFPGQTWTMTILRLILQAQDLEDGNDISLTDFYQKIPFMEVEGMDGETGADKLRKIEGQRFMKTHLSYELWKKQLDKYPNLKVIQTLRNPKDTLVSFYHHTRNSGTMGCFNGTWDQYFEAFKRKQLAWGDYFEVNSSWLKFNQDRPNSLILRYEEMKRDHRNHVIKIAKFLGYDLADSTIDLIVKNSTVEEMAKKFLALEKNGATWKSERSHFIRKGQVGDWVNYFSEEQSEYID